MDLSRKETLVVGDFLIRSDGKELPDLEITGITHSGLFTREFPHFPNGRDHHFIRNERLNYYDAKTRREYLDK